MYKGKECNCRACQGLSAEEREAKYQRIQAARRQGGKTRAAQPSMKEARSAGFWATMDSHPFFARKWLRKKIKSQNAIRARRAATKTIIQERPARRRRPMN
jgi:hypothetical protein